MGEHPAVARATSAAAPPAATGRLRHSTARDLTSLIAEVKTLVAGRASWADGLAVQRTVLDKLSDRNPIDMKEMRLVHHERGRS